VTQDGVVIAADTRATAGTIVVEKNCEKIHYVAPNIWACGAGTAADTQFVNLFMSSNLELQRLNSGRETRVAAFVAFVTRLLYKYEGELGAHLIAGGYDALGPHIAMISGYGKYRLWITQLLISSIRCYGFGIAERHNSAGVQIP
jgi:20S proteasome subunit beta 2